MQAWTSKSKKKRKVKVQRMFEEREEEEKLNFCFNNLPIFNVWRGEYGNGVCCCFVAMHSPWSLPKRRCVLFWKFFLCCVGRGHGVGILGQTVVQNSATMMALLEKQFNVIATKRFNYIFVIFYFFSKSELCLSLNVIAYVGQSKLHAHVKFGLKVSGVKKRYGQSKLEYGNC